MNLKKDNLINIACASDDKYAIMMGAMIKSIEINHKTSERINIYIIDKGITKSNKEKILKSIKSKKIKLIWKKINKKILEKLKAIGKSIDLTAHYYRLLIPYLLPKNIEKVIYLDCDLLVLEDISKLWNISLDNYLIAAIQDGCNRRLEQGVPNYKELNLDGQSKCFNTGVLVINFKKWRKEKISEKVILCTEENKNNIILWDQYGLNVILNNNWMELDNSWNMFQMFQLKQSPPKILHYVIPKLKPIYPSHSGDYTTLLFNYLDKHSYTTLFFNYLDKTSWKGWRPYKKINKNMVVGERSELPMLLKRLGLDGMGVEIGVQEGIFSEKILQDSNLKILYSIDPWLECNKGDYLDIANVSQEKQDRRYLNAISRLMKFKTRSMVMRTTSEEASKFFKYETLDFVYIDALHTYKGCKEDIEIWWPKLRRGGILAGHDYLNGRFPFGIFGVKKAVDEFVKKYKLKLYVTEKSQDGGLPTWYLMKE